MSTYTIERVYVLRSLAFIVDIILGYQLPLLANRNTQFPKSLVHAFLKNLVKFLFHNKKTTQGNHANDAIHDSYYAYCGPFSNI